MSILYADPCIASSGISLSGKMQSFFRPFIYGGTAAEPLHPVGDAAWQPGVWTFFAEHMRMGAQPLGGCSAPDEAGVGSCWGGSPVPCSCSLKAALLGGFDPHLVVPANRPLPTELFARSLSAFRLVSPPALVGCQDAAPRPGRMKTVFLRPQDGL